MELLMLKFQISTPELRYVSDLLRNQKRENGQIPKEVSFNQHVKEVSFFFIPIRKTILKWLIHFLFHFCFFPPILPVKPTSSVHLIKVPFVNFWMRCCPMNELLIKANSILKQKFLKNFLTKWIKLMSQISHWAQIAPIQSTLQDNHSYFSHKWALSLTLTRQCFFTMLEDSLGVITEAVTSSFISFQFLIFITVKLHIIFHTMIYKLQKGSKRPQDFKGSCQE